MHAHEMELSGILWEKKVNNEIKKNERQIKRKKKIIQLGPFRWLLTVLRLLTYFFFWYIYRVVRGANF